MHIPEILARNIRGVFGQEGEDWIRQIPQLLISLSELWELELLPPYQDLTYSYVVPVNRKDGSSAVLKLGLGKELLTEIAVLGHVGGKGMVRLLDTEKELGALLLERLVPGIPVLQLERDEKMCEIAAELMLQYWKAPPSVHPFPSVMDYAKGFERLHGKFHDSSGPFPAKLVERAERLFVELGNSQMTVVVLHGDLHHWNILSAKRQPWLAIDPKGIIGEPAYEVGAWLRNPIGQLRSDPDAVGLFNRRVDQFAGLLEIDRERLKGWGFAQSVLSAWWGYEDQDPKWKDWLAWSSRIYDSL